MNVDIRDNWYPWTEKLFSRFLEWGYIGLILNMLVTVIFVFMVCIILDFVRSLIFNGIEKNLIEQYETTKAIKEAKK